MSEEKQEVKVADPALVKAFLESVQERHEACEIEGFDKYSFGAWSYSKMKQLENCPFQFYLNYVLKVKVPETIGGRRETLSADVGTAGHRILELVMLGKSDEVSFALAKKEFVPSKLTEVQWEEHVATFAVSVSSFRDRMDTFGRRHPIKRIFTEMRIGVTKDWESCAFFDASAYYRGIIDLALQLEDGALVVIDHKTYSGFTPSSTKNFDTQLHSYLPLFHYGVSPINGAQAGIHFIRAADIKMGQYHDRATIEGKLRKQLEWNLEGNVSRVQELTLFKHKCGNYCQWCPYESLCKSKEKLLKPLELDTKRKVIQLKKIG